MSSASGPAVVAGIDWNRWTPVDRATLLFVVRDGEILLIRKKRGLGAGKINAPGGRIEPGETPIDAAIREAREEVGVTAIAPVEVGELHFEFVDGYSIHVRVFYAEVCHGEPRETAEAKPRWHRLEDIPYEEMWADDALWLPMMLAGERFRGWFVFDGDRLLDHRLERAHDER